LNTVDPIRSALSADVQRSYVSHLGVVLAGDVANGNQNNNKAVTQQDCHGQAAFTDSETEQDMDNDGDGSVDSQDTEDIVKSSLKRHPSDISRASDTSPKRKKKRKSLERLTQIKQEEVNFQYFVLIMAFQYLVLLLSTYLSVYLANVSIINSILFTPHLALWCIARICHAMILYLSTDSVLVIID